MGEFCINLLEENLKFLASLAELSEEDFKASRQASYSAAYALMICIESVSGVASHLLATTSELSPTGMAHSFELLEQVKIIKSPELAAKLSKMSRFRNLIVHRYWKVDYGFVHQILTNHLEDFRDFASDIDAFLSQEEL